VLWSSVFAVVGLVGFSSQLTYQEALANTRSFAESGKLDEAIALAEELVEAEPEMGPAYLMLGDLYRRVWRPREAIETFSRALEETSLPPADLHREMAVTYAELHDWDRALARAELSLELAPDDPQGLFTKAMVLSQKGTRGEALRLYESLLEADPDNESLHFRVGEIQESLQRLEEAEAAYRRVIELEPGHQGARFRLGQMLLADGRSVEAERELARAVKISVGHAASHLELAKTYEALGRNAKAKHHYERAIALDPWLANAHMSYGNYALRNGDEELGRSHLERFKELTETSDRISALVDAVEFEPDDADAKDALVDFLVDKKQFPLALRMTQRFVLAAPDDPHGHALMVRIYDAWGRVEDASRARAHVAERFPDATRR